MHYAAFHKLQYAQIVICNLLFFMKNRHVVRHIRRLSIDRQLIFSDDHFRLARVKLILSRLSNFISLNRL
jgi:hypothetical protein